MYRIFLNFAKSCILSCLSKFDFKKKFHCAGIAPDEPSELENLLDTIIALEESADAESQESRAEK